jgi:hypothetical protein
MEKLLFEKLLNIHKTGINNVPTKELAQIKEDFKKLLNIEFEVMDFTYSPTGACAPCNRFNLYFYKNTEDNKSVRYIFLEDGYKLDFLHSVLF